MPYAASPYRQNLPRWAKITGIIILVIGQYFISGLNGNIGFRIVSYFGLDSSKVSFFLHISTVGLVVMFPLAYRFRDFFKRISLLLWAMGLQLLICMLCYITYNETLLLISSILMGALKIVIILDFLALIIGLFPFMRNRGLLYGIFYGFSRIMGEVSTYTTLHIVENYHWSSVFLFSAGVAAISILLTLVFFHNSRIQRKVPLYQIDWISVILLMISGISLCYITVMGKEKDWFASTQIINATLIFIPSTVAFIYRQLHLKRPFWNLRVFKKYKQVPLGFGLMLLLFFFHETSILLHTYTDYNFSGEEHYLAHLTLIQILSYLIGFPLAGYLFYKGIPKRILLCFGFLCYAASLIYFSNIIQSTLSFSDLVLPLSLGDLAYAFTLTTAAAFMSTNILREDNKDRAMGSIYARYVLGSFGGYALYTNWLFRGTTQNASFLSKNINLTQLPFSKQFNQISAGFLSRGTDLHIARQKALQIIQQKVHVQAMLMTIRDITCIVGVLALITAIVILFVRKLEMHKVEGKNSYKIIP